MVVSNIIFFSEQFNMTINSYDEFWDEIVLWWYLDNKYL